jgi:hypothetical protein
MDTEPLVILELSLTEQRYPPHDPSHATPHVMVRRLITIRAPRGEARFEQTDYGHPGRFNTWEPRGIAPGLQSRTYELEALCQRLGSILA